MNKILQTKLRNIFFEIITNTNDNSPCMNEKILLEIATQLVHILQYEFIAIYMVDDWNGQYKRKVVYPKYRELFLQETILPSTFTKKGSFQTDGNITIPINKKGTTTPFGYMISYTKNEVNIDGASMVIIQKELEKVINLLYSYQQMRMKEIRMKYMNAFTSGLISKVDKSSILQELLKFIRKLHPNFIFTIFLTQEYKVDPSLPIKMLEFNHEIGNHLRMTAFLTGDAQKELDDYNGNLKLYVPLEGRQAIYGVLQIETNNAIDFPQQELDFISQLAGFTGKAIENVALYQSSNQQVEDLKLINETSKKLNSNIKIEEIIKIIRKRIMKTSHCSEIGFVKIEEEHASLLEESTSFFFTKEGKQLAHYFIHKNEQEPFFTGDFKMPGNIPYRSVMVVPMKHDVFTYGMVIILHEEPYFFTFEKYKIIQSLVMHSTLSILNAFLLKQLEQTVKTDYVTKMYTRNHLDEKIHEHMKKGKYGTLILFDIDDFKQINDTFGHHIGDEVLKQVAIIIQRNTRSGDIAARWGGEELAVYLPEVMIEKGVEIAKRISREIEKETNPEITVSAGVSTWNEAIPNSLVELFVRTDQALYEAKGAGKNRVVMKSIH